MAALVHRDLVFHERRIFYREAGPPDAPILLLPQSYPCLSFQYRRLMPALSARWRTIAPDFPGFGYSDTPSPTSFAYDFDAYAQTLSKFADVLDLDRYAWWLHDYGSQIGLRHAIARPERITALIVQNGDIYQDALGPKYETIKAYWTVPTDANRALLVAAVSEEGFRKEFLGEVDAAVAARIPPDLWKLHWPLMNMPLRRDLAVGLIEKLEQNLAWFPHYRAYLRKHRPPALIVWGPDDGYMPEAAARAYLRDLPDAELHLLEGAGHWLLETHFDEALPLVRDFWIESMADRRQVLALAGLILLPACMKGPSMTTRPAIARIWRGRTRRDVADRYEPYLRSEGIPPLEKVALGVQLFREDRTDESWFVTVSYWSSMAAMTDFTKGDPTAVHHLDRDEEFLIELPDRVEILKTLVDRQGLRERRS